MSELRRRLQVRGGGLAAPTTYLVCAIYLNCFGSLLAWTVVPAIAGLRPVVIVSGSMAPAVKPGDVVLMGEPVASRIQRGDVVLFKDSAHAGRLLTHRVANLNADGSLKTRGDANLRADSTPVPSGQVQGVGRFVIPGLGAPVIWVRDGQWLLLSLWFLATVLAVLCLRGFPRGRARMASWSTPLIIAPSSTAQPATSAQARANGWEAPVPVRRRLRPGIAATAVVVIAVAVVAPRVVAGHAAWAGEAANPGNDFVAATSFCSAPGTQTLIASGDAAVRQLSPTTNYGSAVDLVVDPRTNRAARSLVRFALPAQPSYCLMTATMRVRATAPTAGRILQASRAGSAWTENTVTWDTQPSTTGTEVATATAPAAPGWITFDVSSHVTAMYAGADHGFVLRDANEPAGANLDQALSSRTGANPPELVLTFSPVPLPPAAPTGLSASSVTDAVVGLTWTDNGANEDELVVQRSLGGTGAWTDIATLAPDTATYTDSGRSPGTTYDYRVRAVNLGGPSPWSDVASVTTNLYPPAPTGLTLVGVGVNDVAMRWTDNSAYEVSFQIQVSPSGLGTWTTAGTVGAGATTFSATGLTADTSYDFRVAAQNTGGDSAWSNVLTARTNACATVPAQTLIATADAALLQMTPTTALGSTQPLTFLTRARVNENARSLVQFGAPTMPIGCSVATATLRLNVTSQTAVRTVQVARASAAWTEASVTWNSQPATTGTPAVANTALGWVQWNVKDNVVAMLAGLNHGFLISDVNEGGGSPNDTNMSSREGANPPELVVTVGP